MISLLEDHKLLENERIHRRDLRREVFVLPNGESDLILANLIAARHTEQGYRSSIIMQDTNLESVLSIVSFGHFVTITIEASQGVIWPGLRLRDRCIIPQSLIHLSSWQGSGVMADQLGFADGWASPKLRRNPGLERLSDAVDWAQLERLLCKLRHDGPGRPAFPALMMFKAVLLQQWYGLSDAEA